MPEEVNHDGPSEPGCGWELESPPHNILINILININRGSEINRGSLKQVDLAGDVRTS